MSEQTQIAEHEMRMLKAEEVRLLREEARQANERADRMQRDSTAELLKHQEERAGMLQKIQDQKNLIHDLNTRHLEDVTLAGARDRRIAELEGAIRTFLYDGNIREGAMTANGCTCKYSLESVEALDAALAGEGVRRG